MGEMKPAGQVPPDAGAEAATAAAKAATEAAAAKATADAAAAAVEAGAKAKPGSKADTLSSGSKAPEQYALAIPKGTETFIDAADLSEVAGLAKANDWTNDEAQEFLDVQAAVVSTKLTAFRTDTEADAEYGGEKLEASQQLVRRVVDRVRPSGHPRAEAFRRILMKTGIGNHIEMFSFLADLGKLMREDSPPGQGGGSQQGERSQAEILYPTSGKAA